MTPNGIRVWQGYRSAPFRENTEGFLVRLGQLFIPITVQLMTPLGLRMYYPALLPQQAIKLPVGLPDEIALVGYSSQKIYQDASHHTVAGKAYTTLHDTVFNFTSGEIPVSFSDFPLAFTDNTQLQWKIPYYFSGEAIDWHRCYVAVIVWTWPSAPLAVIQQYGQHLANHFAKAIAGNKNLFEIISVMQPHYGIVWFASSTLSWPTQIVDTLSDMDCQLVMQAFHDTVNISPLFSENDNGIDLTSGQALDVRLST